MIVNEISLVIQNIIPVMQHKEKKKNYNSKRKDNKEKVQQEDERNVIL